MAEAIINALSKKDGQRMTDVSVFDVNSGRLQYLHSTYNVKINDNIDDNVESADVVILSVKPQNVATVAQSLSAPPKGLLLSIVAGCTIEQLRTSFKTDTVVRSMPNTPAMVLEGISGMNNHMI
jgi:pyrroline-5-carboxylate reductase